MIPATQRPDGSWRKARRTREGFDSISGGAPRYVPPPYRNNGVVGDHGESASSGGNQTRSLTEVVAPRRGVGRGRHLSAALFLRTESATLQPSSDGERGRNSSAECVLSTEATMAYVRSATAAAEEQLGCDSCRLLYPEISTESGSPNAAPQHFGGNDGSGTWWARLRQVERGAIAGCTEGAWGRGLWVGITLSICRSDVDYGDGQAAIIDFLRSLVVLKEEEDGQEGKVGVHVTAVGARRATVKPTEGRRRSFASEGEDEESHSENMQEGGATRDNDGGFRRRKNESAVGRKEEVERADIAPVTAAILLFDGELSKRDRAGLHGQAENTAGVASSSHGVGDARFLALRCGRGVISSAPAAGELQLSGKQAEVARRLFRLAQQEYHSRYERLSHREIREVVALGGPRAEDHPDLFRLLERIDDCGIDEDPPKRPYRKSHNEVAQEARRMA